MKAALKSKLASNSLFPCAAKPVFLNLKEMDRITAGAQQMLERFANVFVTADAAIKLSDLWSLIPNQQVLITQLESGGQLVLFKQIGAVDPTTVPQTSLGDLVTAHAETT